MIFVFVCLTYFTQYDHLGVHFVAIDIISLFFITEQYSIVYMYHIFFIHFFVLVGHLSCFRVLATVSSAAVSTEDHVYFQIMVFSRYMPSSRTVGSYGNSSFRFLRNLHTILYSTMHQLTFPPIGQESSLLHTLSSIH